jgi:hypothetical protein
MGRKISRFTRSFFRQLVLTFHEISGLGKLLSAFFGFNSQSAAVLCIGSATGAIPGYKRRNEYDITKKAML